MLRFMMIGLMLTATPALAEEPASNPASQPAAKQVDAGKVAEVLTLTEYDVVQGEASAPLTMVEYSSMSCSHCATFHNTVLPTLKKDYIETGKLRFVNRDFPLNAPALKASMLVQCAPKDKQAKFQEVLFKLQGKWAFSNRFEDALEKIAGVGGVDSDTFAACMENKEIEERVLAVRQQAGEHLDIQGTPTFYLNGEKMDAVLTVEAFKAALDAKLAP